MAIVTLTSDWNKDDFYSAAIRAKILSRCREAILVDISHQVPAFNVSIAAFLVRHSVRHFPPGTIHLVMVNSESEQLVPYIALKSGEQYFIGYDNGMFGLIFEEEPEEIVLLEGGHPGSFPELTIFVETACSIMESGSLEGLGKRVSGFNKHNVMLPAIDESLITGSVVYVDSYKNAITNISRELFDQIGKGRSFDIFVQSNHYRLNRINTHYSQTATGEILALFNSLDLLEIALNGGNASELLNLNLNSSIRIRFSENKQERS